jgi:DNA-binding NarL/FixJ family response regulator
MKEAIRILIADDFPMFREGIRLMLAKEDNISIVAEADNGEELTSLFEQCSPDVVITDIEMPRMNGIEATKQIRMSNSKVGIIALTMFGDDHLIVDMLDAGANGYLLKSSKKEELLEAIESANEGGSYFCNSTTMKLSKMIASTKTVSNNEEIKFSDKEIEIMRLICEQYASKEIALQTNLTHKTVEKYRDHIMTKTGSRNVVGIVIYAIRNGIYKP